MRNQAQAYTLLIYNITITTFNIFLTLAAYYSYMNPLEFFVSLLAPHLCLFCGKEGSSLCNKCSVAAIKSPPGVCYRCSKASLLNPCSACASLSPLKSLSIAAEYSGIVKDLIASLKFNRVKSAAEVIAGQIHNKHPPINKSTVVVPVPTANSRVRKRGYDQASLIAKHFAKKRKLKYSELFRRVGSTRQVGAGREDRFKQLKNSFRLKKHHKTTGKHFLLVDDVLTTGATLESAGRLLVASGAASVSAAVFAYSTPKAMSSSSTRSDLVSAPQ